MSDIEARVKKIIAEQLGVHPRTVHRYLAASVCSGCGGPALYGQRCLDCRPGLARAATGPEIVAALRAWTAEHGAPPHEHTLVPGSEGHVPRVAPGVVCAVSGHTAMVSFPDLPGRVSLEEIERHWPDLLPGLVDHDGVGFLLVHSDEFGPVVLGREGLHRL